MVYLICSILCSTIIFVVFKLFGRFKIEILPAIVINYWVASLCGVINAWEHFSIIYVVRSDWFLGTLLLGMLFISVFQIIAKASQILGVATTAIATKMSLIIPVVVSLLFYAEETSFQKTLGILIALIAVYLGSKPNKEIPFSKKSWLFIFITFVGSGIIDAAINYFERFWLTDAEFPMFSATAFGSAGLTGIFWLAIQNKTNGSLELPKTILGGLALGIPNYFSIFFLLGALRQYQDSVAMVFTINNVGIVLLSSLIGVIAFVENKSWINWLGLCLAILGILLVGLA